MGAREYSFNSPPSLARLLIVAPGGRIVPLGGADELAGPSREHVQAGRGIPNVVRTHQLWRTGIETVTTV